MFGVHKLYNNSLYHHLTDQQIDDLLKTQEKFLSRIDQLGLPAEETEFAFFKRECLYFEIHRRRFTSCFVEMLSSHRVKQWLTTADQYQRCNCCYLEYYEYECDLQRVEKGEIEATKILKFIQEGNFLHGGRSFFERKEINDATEMPEMSKVEYVTGFGARKKVKKDGGLSQSDNDLASEGVSIEVVSTKLGKHFYIGMPKLPKKRQHVSETERPDTPVEEPVEESPENQGKPEKRACNIFKKFENKVASCFNLKEK